MLQLLLFLSLHGLYVCVVGGGIGGWIAGANAWTYERFLVWSLDLRGQLYRLEFRTWCRRWARNSIVCFGRQRHWGLDRVPIYNCPRFNCGLHQTTKRQENWSRPEWLCLRGVNPKDVRELSSELRAVLLAGNSMAVYQLHGRLNPLDNLPNLSSRLFMEVGGFGLAEFRPLSDPVP